MTCFVMLNIDEAAALSSLETADNVYVAIGILVSARAM